MRRKAQKGWSTFPRSQGHTARNQQNQTCPHLCAIPRPWVVQAVGLSSAGVVGPVQSHHIGSHYTCLSLVTTKLVWPAWLHRWLWLLPQKATQKAWVLAGEGQAPHGSVPLVVWGRKVLVDGQKQPGPDFHLPYMINMTGSVSLSFPHLSTAGANSLPNLIRNFNLIFIDTETVAWKDELT